MKMSGLGGALIMDDLDDVNDLVDEEDEDEKESDTASVGWNDELLDEMKVQFGVVRDKLKLKGKVASSVRRLNAFTTAYGLIYGVGFNATIPYFGKEKFHCFHCGTTYKSSTQLFFHWRYSCEQLKRLHTGYLTDSEKKNLQWPCFKACGAWYLTQKDGTECDKCATSEMHNKVLKWMKSGQ
eukprot:35610_1